MPEVVKAMVPYLLHNFHILYLYACAKKLSSDSFHGMWILIRRKSYKKKFFSVYYYYLKKKMNRSLSYLEVIHCVRLFNANKNSELYVFQDSLKSFLPLYF